MLSGQTPAIPPPPADPIPPESITRVPWPRLDSGGYTVPSAAADFGDGGEAEAVASPASSLYGTVLPLGAPCDEYQPVHPMLQGRKGSVAGISLSGDVVFAHLLGDAREFRSPSPTAVSPMRHGWVEAIGKRGKPSRRWMQLGETKLGLFKQAGGRRPAMSIALASILAAGPSPRSPHHAFEVRLATGRTHTFICLDRAQCPAWVRSIVEAVGRLQGKG